MIDKMTTLLLKKMHITISETNQTTLNQFFRFVLVGISNVAASYVFNIATLLILSRWNISWDYVIGNIVSFILSVLWSFYWNNRYVFKQTNNTSKNLLKSLIKTYICYSFSCLILGNLFSWFFIEIGGISKYVSPLLVSCVSIPVNFLLNKFWAFKK